MYRIELRKRAFQVIGSRCIFCGTDENIQASHVLPTKLKGAGRGLDRRYRDVLANPDSYRPMYKNCHKTFDQLVARIKQTVIVEEPIPF